MFFTIIFCTFHSGSRPGVADFHDDLRKNELKAISDEVMIMVLRAPCEAGVQWFSVTS